MKPESSMVLYTYDIEGSRSPKNLLQQLNTSMKAMAPHSSVLAWRIPGTGEPGGLPSMGLHRVGHD